MKILFHVLAAAFVTMAGLAPAGCLLLGPEYERPALDIDMPDKFLTAEDSATRPYAAGGNWWTEFEDARLNRVVARVIAGNPDMRKAAASVLEARALAGQSRADRFPELSLEARASRQEQTAADPVSGEPVTVESEDYSLALPASFELDLWGRLARASQAARAELLAAEANRRTISQSLIAEAVSQYFRVQSLQAQLGISRRLQQTRRESLTMVKARYRRGLATVLDVQQARRGLARTEAEIPSLVQTLGKARHALDVLQGIYPGRKKDAPQQAPQLASEQETRTALPPPIPAGLPSELLNRRPDIRAAEASLEAACARIGAARANRFPRISLTGQFGYTSEELDLLLKPESELWKIGAGLFQPLFDAGRRKSVQRAAEARYQQQLAGYAKTVLNALAEVEDALLTRQQQLARRDRLLTYRDQAEATLATARDRYQRGLSGYLNVLDAQEAKLQADLDLVKTRYAIYANRVALYRALGGGWGDEKAVPAE
ncbi:MAG: efflux transporter outer membrane subunit [Desulfosudaceae bacterium]